MNIIFTTLRRLIAAFTVRETSDTLSRMTARELADLPVYHPKFDA